MYLLDSMERGTPQRRTVYRISLTLVKKESMDEGQPQQTGDATPEGLGREGSTEVPRSGQLEELREVEDEAEEFSPSRGFLRSFRTFSTGQLELGKLKSCRKLLKARSPLAEQKKEMPGPGPNGTKQDGEGSGPAQNGSASKRKRLLKAKSVEDKRSEPPVNGDGPACPGTPPLKPAPLHRSFSFRHWSGSELLRALSRDKQHSSSGSIAPRPPDPTREKSRTLEVGAVLNRTESLSELSRSDRAREAKNRTLDNSDLLRLTDADGRGGFLRGGGGRSSERRLARFFSGIFRREGAASPAGSPGLGRSLRRSRRTPLTQSSSESMNGADGKPTLRTGSGSAGSGLL
ncbi:hypothetical protein OJAV_G00014010 [Oryzias javanicus]|uniref:Uncharacterized protein n=1 Tax=Oryzias javanicus TaxID=123683 RepID=A0A3S2Q9Y1_ORYJA|nr:hypothetical protein OJAV_G00014010 [Oryzias javanicus]